VEKSTLFYWENTTRCSKVEGTVLLQNKAENILSNYSERELGMNGKNSPGEVESLLCEMLMPTPMKPTVS